MALAEGHSKNGLSGAAVAKYLINKSLSVSTRNTYSNAFKLFNKFLGSYSHSSLANSLPVHADSIALLLLTCSVLIMPLLLYLRMYQPFPLSTKLETGQTQQIVL